MNIHKCWIIWLMLAVGAGMWLPSATAQEATAVEATTAPPAEAVPASPPPEETTAPVAAPAEVAVPPEQAAVPTEVPAEQPAEPAVNMEAATPPPAETAPPAETTAPVETPVVAEMPATTTETPYTAEPAPAPTAPAAELIELGAEMGLPEGAAVSGGEKSELISITLDKVSIADVISMFTRISGANIVAGTNLVGAVTVNLKDVEWRPAMNVILDSVNLALVEKSPGIYTVMSKGELAAEPVTLETVYLKFTTVSNIAPMVQKMLISSNASVAGFPSANAVVIQETSARLNIIKEMIICIDKQRPQCFVEAKFVELNDQAIKDLGINWAVLQNYNVQAGNLARGLSDERSYLSSRRDSINQFDNRQNNDTLSELYDADNKETLSSSRSVIDTIDRGQSVLSDASEDYLRNLSDIRTAVLSVDDFKLTLSALKQNDGVQIVSNPRIVVASGETAMIHVGRNEPNVQATLSQSTAGGGAASYYVYGLADPPFIEIGVRVSVTPTVNTESNITVKISPELSRKLSDKIVGDAVISFPVTQIRRLTTEFNLESGRTVAIGGLTTTEDTENVKKIPLLGDIPIIGKYLFRWTHTSKVQDEVIIFVTVGMANPEVLSSSAGIPSQGRLIHRHMAREASAAGGMTDMGSDKPGK